MGKEEARELQSTLPNIHTEKDNETNYWEVNSYTPWEEGDKKCPTWICQTNLISFLNKATGPADKEKQFKWLYVRPKMYLDLSEAFEIVLYAHKWTGESSSIWNHS